MKFLTPIMLLGGVDLIAYSYAMPGPQPLPAMIGAFLLLMVGTRVERDR